MSIHSSPSFKSPRAMSSPSRQCSERRPPPPFFWGGGGEGAYHGHDHGDGSRPHRRHWRCPHSSAVERQNAGLKQGGASHVASLSCAASAPSAAAYTGWTAAAPPSSNDDERWGTASRNERRMEASELAELPQQINKSQHFEPSGLRPPPLASVQGADRARNPFFLRSMPSAHAEGHSRSKAPNGYSRSKAEALRRSRRGMSSSNLRHPASDR